jgi:hypothetical protein
VPGRRVSVVELRRHGEITGTGEILDDSVQVRVYAE